MCIKICQLLKVFNDATNILFGIYYPTTNLFIIESLCHNGFPLDLDDHKNEWSHHRSFLYGCDRLSGVHVLKLGIEIPNLK